jgi:hypothetical protein
MKPDNIIYHTICKRDCDFSRELLIVVLSLIRVQIRSASFEFTANVRDKHYYNIRTYFYFSEPISKEDRHNKLEIVKERLEIWTASQRES